MRTPQEKSLLRPAITLILIASLILSGSLSASDVAPSFKAAPLVKPRKNQTLLPGIKESLIQRDGEAVRIWVFFTDKSVFSQTEFDRKASEISITPRAMKRRAKVDLDRVVFADLPVSGQYIELVEQLGGKLRRISRWLNAASFVLPAGQLDAVSELSFVREIRPIALYKHESEPVPNQKIDNPPDKTLGGDVLNYGAAAGQLAQINVPPVHEMGYSGAGVTLAIFDTGYRKSHIAFAAHYLSGRVLAEYDFIFNDSNTANEGPDWSSQWNHGTYIWSTSGGYDDGSLIGPAYGANFILCKTEDIRSETQVEEDNWVAALEWVDSLGADVVTSSLSYLGWDDGTGYSQSDLDGLTAVTSIAASMAADMGIVVCNAAGNSGPTSPSLSAPPDALDILTVGAVGSGGTLASFSSRGPTADGRIKPEVVAQGVSTACATASADNSYGTKSGTSLSTPLVAGAVCLVIEAKPYWTPRQVRWALMETADNAASPNNDYGWGLIDVAAALNWGANFSSDITIGNAPATIQFTDNSTVTPLSWSWDFGDGDTSTVQNPSHTYNDPGAYDVTLTIGTDSMGNITEIKQGYVILLADTLEFQPTVGIPGSQVVMSVNLKNSQDLTLLTIPFTIEESPFITFDSATLGDRTLYFERFQMVGYSPSTNSYAFDLQADDGGGRPPLAPGSGEVMRLYFSLSPVTPLGTAITIDTASTTQPFEVVSEFLTYTPATSSGTVEASGVIRGDVDGSGEIDIADLVYLSEYMFNFGPPPVSETAGDVDASGELDISDLVYLVDYMFNNGPPPPA